MIFYKFPRALKLCGSEEHSTCHETTLVPDQVWLLAHTAQTWLGNASPPVCPSTGQASVNCISLIVYVIIICVQSGLPKNCTCFPKESINHMGNTKQQKKPPKCVIFALGLRTVSTVFPKFQTVITIGMLPGCLPKAKPWWCLCGSPEKWVETRSTYVL